MNPHNKLWEFSSEQSEHDGPEVTSAKFRDGFREICHFVLYSQGCVANWVTELMRNLFSTRLERIGCTTLSGDGFVLWSC